MLTETPLVQELKLDIALSKANGQPTREQLIHEIKGLEDDQELIHEEVISLLADLEAD